MARDGELSNQVLAALRALGRDDTPGTRRAARAALDEHTPGQTIAALLARSVEPDPLLAYGAARLLGVRGPSVLPAIDQVLRDPRPHVRRYATVALAALDNAAGRTRLIILLADPEANVRAWAAAALGALHDPGVLPLLDHALADPASDVRRYAIEALRAQGGAEALAILVRHLDESNTLVLDELNAALLVYLDASRDQFLALLAVAALTPQTARNATALLHVVEQHGAVLLTYTYPIAL